MAEQESTVQQDLAKLMESRVSMYSMLAQLFQKEVSTEQLHELQRMNFPTGTGNTLVDEGYRDMYDYLKLAWDQSVDELKVDYARTFIGHGSNGYSAAYLYESVYTSGRRLLAREARGEVLAAYRENGLKKGKWNDMEDHLGLMLEFMQVLASRSCEALQAQDYARFDELLEKQHDFVQNHLLNWLPMMLDDVLRFAQTSFYQGLAKLVLGYAEVDEELLRELVVDAEQAA